MINTEINSMQDISLHLLDLAQNSIAAGATLVDISVREFPKEGYMLLRIRDNGKGMDAHQLNRVSDPFYTTRTSRKVGLGIPLFRASAEATGGYLKIISRKDEGTTLLALFHTNHIDCLQLGNLEESMAALIYLNPEINFTYCHELPDKQFYFDTSEVREILGEVSITEPAVVDWIKEYIKNGLEELYGGA